MFAHSWISSIQFKTEVQLFRLRIAVKAIFQSTFAQAASFPIKYTIDLPRFQSNIPSIILVSNQIYDRIDGILFASSKYGKRPLVMKN